MCLFLMRRCESAGGDRKWSVAAGSKWSGKGLLAHQQTKVSTNGCTWRTQCIDNYIRYMCCMFKCPSGHSEAEGCVQYVTLHIDRIILKEFYLGKCFYQIAAAKAQICLQICSCLFREPDLSRLHSFLRPSLSFCRKKEQIASLLFVLVEE